MDRAINGAAFLMHRMDTLDGRAVRIGSCQVVGDMDAFDDENLLLELDFARDVGGQLTDSDLARCQRASECSRQSAAGSGDDVVERRGVGLVLRRIDTIVLCNGAVNAEADRFPLAGQPGQAQRSALAFDADFGLVNHVTHRPYLTPCRAVRARWTSAIADE